jgi:hypothetical protein
MRLCQPKSEEIVLREINAENLWKNINSKGFKERVRTWTTSSKPLALVKICLFLVSRTLATKNSKCTIFLCMACI